MSMRAFAIIRYPKGNLNVIKRQKISFSGLKVLLTGLWDLKVFKIRAKTVLKINWSVKMPSHEGMEVARSGLYGLLLLHVKARL